MQYYGTLQIRTAKEAVNHLSPSLAKIKKEAGNIVSSAFLSSILIDLIISFNVGKTMNESQIVSTAQGIQEDYYFLKPSELKYCFDNGKKGRYGQLYDRIDQSIIFDWIEKYLEERIGICEQNNIEEQKKNRFTDEDCGFLLKNVKTILDKTTDQTDNKIKIPEKRELTKSEIFVQQVFKEFDEIHRKTESDLHQTIRMINYKGKYLTQSDFLIQKLQENDSTDKEY